MADRREKRHGDTHDKGHREKGQTGEIINKRDTRQMNKKGDRETKNDEK